MHPVAANIFEENRLLGATGRRLLWSALAVGAAGMAAAVLLARFGGHGAERFFHAYLAAYAYFLSLALGALFFVMLQHLTRSGWSVVVRRLAEGVAAAMPLLALLAIPIILGRTHLYQWINADASAGDHLLQWKKPYLNNGFFLARMAVYLAVWVFLARYMYRNSVRQDAGGDIRLTLRMERLSAPGMVLFALTITFAAFDLLMSLDPRWYSTIFGVYYFSGGVVGFLALLTVMTYAAQCSGRLTHAVTPEHYHDLGKLLFAFVVFWAYIAFSQYMLTWYANIPEETAWYLRRQEGDWAAVSILLLLGHFAAPFLALISRIPKRRPGVLVVGAVWMLLMHWVDIYWLVMPGTRFAANGRVPLGLIDLAAFLGVGGLFMAATVQRLRTCSLVPERDPRLLESLTFENV